MRGWSSRANLAATLVLTSCGGLSVYTARDTATCAPNCAGTADADTDADSDADTDTDPTTPSGEDCTDGSDNNGDGLADCDDPGCDSVCDVDGDGSFADADCNDGEPEMYPGNAEICDSLDNDCDVEVDEDEDADGSDACADCDNADDRRYPGAAELCDGIDSDCNGDDLPSWFEDFEAGPPLPGEFTTSGDASWKVDGTAPYSGAWNGASGNIGDFGVSALSLVVDLCAPGTLSFWRSGETEANYDYFRFYIDSALAGEWSGTSNHQLHTYNLTVGVHTLDWVYSKDTSISVGADAVFLDDIEVVGGTP